MSTAVLQEAEKYLVFKVANELYGLEVFYLKEVFQTKKILKLPRTSEILAGIVNLRGYIVSIFDLSKLLWGLDSSTKKKLEDSSSSSQTKIVLLVTIKGQDVGILADQIQQLVELPDFTEKDPSLFKGKKLQNESLISKIGLTADKKKIFILNLNILLGGYVIPAKAKQSVVLDDEDADFDFDQYTLPDEASDDLMSNIQEEDFGFDIESLTSPDEHELDNFDHTVLSDEKPDLDEIKEKNKKNKDKKKKKT